MRTKVTSGSVLAFRGTVIVMLGINTYLSTTYATKQSVSDYIAAHDKWSQSVLDGIHRDLNKIDARLERMEGRQVRADARAIGRIQP